MPPTIKVDGSATLKFATGELSTEDVTTILEHKMDLGWVVFKENEIKPVDLPPEDAEFEPKRKSVRLRNVLWRLWEQNGKKGSFDEFYANRMEQLIESLKNKLD